MRSTELHNEPPKTEPLPGEPPPPLSEDCSPPPHSGDGFLAEHVGLAFLLARKFKPPPDSLLTEEDLPGEAFLALATAAEKWDPARGSFGTFAWLFVKDRLCRQLAQHKRHLSLPPFNAIRITKSGAPALLCLSLDATPEDADCSFKDALADPNTEDPLQVLLGREEEKERAELVERVLAPLNELERRIVWLRLGEEQSFTQIAGTVGVNRETVRQRFYEALRKIVDFLA